MVDDLKLKIQKYFENPKRNPFIHNIVFTHVTIERTGRKNNFFKVSEGTPFNKNDMLYQLNYMMFYMMVILDIVFSSNITSVNVDFSKLEKKFSKYSSLQILINDVFQNVTNPKRMNSQKEMIARMFEICYLFSKLNVKSFLFHDELGIYREHFTKIFPLCRRFVESPYFENQLFKILEYYDSIYLSEEKYKEMNKEQSYKDAAERRKMALQKLETMMPGGKVSRKRKSWRDIVSLFRNKSRSRSVSRRSSSLSNESFSFSS